MGGCNGKYPEFCNVFFYFYGLNTARCRGMNTGSGIGRPK